MVNVYLLHGGVWSSDGVATSVGMRTLASMLRALPDTVVRTYLWGSWRETYNDLVAVHDAKVALIGYSGGGHKATWVANGYFGDEDYRPRPRIDLMVLYDPSPTWSMMAVRDNVRKAVCYHNTTPFMFGLGGGVLKGPNVTQIDIAMQHFFVQFSGDLHRRTVRYVKGLMP